MFYGITFIKLSFTIFGDVENGNVDIIKSTSVNAGFNSVKFQNSIILNVINVCTRSFSGPFFLAFGVNTEIYSIFSPHAGEYRPEKLQIRGCRPNAEICNKYTSSIY